MPELSDEEFFEILGVGQKRGKLEDHLAVSQEVSELPALVNADGTRYPARRNSPNLLRPAAPAEQVPLNPSTRG